MNAEYLVSIEATLKAIVLLILVLGVRAIGRAAISRQLTFFKVYGQTLGFMTVGWFLGMVRAKLSSADRWSTIGICAAYTTAISLFVSNDVDGLSSPVLFVLFFVVASVLRLFLLDDYTRSFRQFLFAPLFSLLLATIFLGSSISVGAKGLFEAQHLQYVGFLSPALGAAFLLGLVMSFLFIVSAQQGSSVWGHLIQDISEIAFVGPVLLFYLNEGTDVHWLSLLGWATKISVVLILFDISKKFVPRFSLKQPEGWVLKFALPAVGLVFLALYASGAKT